MGQIAFYLDTYALMEIYRGNEKFIPYLDTDFIILDITLAEFYGVLLKEVDSSEADLWSGRLQSHVASAELEILLEAARFRHNNRKSKLSFPDAVGYVYSLNRNYLFVTGDKEFEGMKNVEFRKGK